jgi:hypothetical protein
MKRNSIKKGMDRRKKPRNKSSSSKGTQEICYACSKELQSDARVLFVEEELRRTFCSELCISDYFSPAVEKLEKQYFKRLLPTDFTGEEREGLSHLRWVTLQEPDEVWRQKTPEGDYRYAFISEFSPGTKKVWSVCICLCLRGEPSFLYLAFPTRDRELANFFRTGESIEWDKSAHSGEVEEAPSQMTGNTAAPIVAQADPTVDGLANAWTEDETIRAHLKQQRRGDDIPAEDYSLYQTYLDETLQAPDEVWSTALAERGGLRLYHFIRFYPEEKSGVWYLVIARETEDQEQIEILDAFPTRDPALAERYRTGTQEVGATEVIENRVIH